MDQDQDEEGEEEERGAKQRNTGGLHEQRMDCAGLCLCRAVQGSVSAGLCACRAVPVQGCARV